MSEKVACSCRECCDEQIHVVGYESPVGEIEQIFGAIVSPSCNNPAKEVKCYNPSEDQVEDLESPVIWKKLKSLKVR